jgi:glycine/D-amino acid oxidase-like deaminating enzyme
MPKPAVIPRHTDSNGWWETLSSPPPPRILSGRLRVRTAVVGGGICGVSTANRLAELCPDSDICLIEAERIGNGASGRNAGFMLNLHAHGEPKTLDILRRNMKLWEAGLSSLRHKVETWQIRCNWSEAGRFYGAAGSDGTKNLGNIASTLDALGLPYVMQDRAALERRIGTRFYSSGLHAPGNALVNPAALMRGLAKNLPQNVMVFEDSPVIEFEPLRDGYLVRTQHGEVVADRLVLAAGVFLRQFGIAPAHFVPMATYASLTRPLAGDALAMLGTKEEFGLLGGSEYGATLRLTQDNRLFVRNYFDFVPGAPASRTRVKEIARMHRRAMVARWPGLAEIPFEHSWGGVMAFTRNNGSVFGAQRPNLYAILTNDVSPMTRGEAAGALLAEHIEGIDSDLLALQLTIPEASRLPPRPVLDLGVSLRRSYLHAVARNEF